MDTCTCIDDFDLAINLLILRSHSVYTLCIFGLVGINVLHHYGQELCAMNFHPENENRIKNQV